ncbi:unnamed protein product [Ectocarpus fasciculatus]
MTAACPAYICSTREETEHRPKTVGWTVYVVKVRLGRVSRHKNNENVRRVQIYYRGHSRERYPRLTLWGLKPYFQGSLHRKPEIQVISCSRSSACSTGEHRLDTPIPSVCSIDLLRTCRSYRSPSNINYCCPLHRYRLASKIHNCSVGREAQQCD